MIAFKAISDNEAVRFAGTIVFWASQNYAAYPWRITANHWHALVAEIMLQRTAAEQVLPVYEAFCQQYKTPTDYYLYSDGTLFDSLGLKWREEKLHELAEALSGKDIPKDSDQLLQLPGVGSYIAAAYRSLHLGLFDVIIDSNIVRLYGRYFGFKTDGETRRKKQLKELSAQLTPQKDFRLFNYGLIDFTRTICRPRPKCNSCILKKRCAYNIYISSDPA